LVLLFERRQLEKQLVQEILEGGARLGLEEHFLEGELDCMVQRDAVVAAVGAGDPQER